MALGAGASMNVTIPAGVAPGTMFNVQVPITPVAPVSADGKTVANPLSAPGPQVSGEPLLQQLGGIHIEQVIA